MKIVVCLKQVPDTTAVKIDPKTGTLIRDGVPSIINPEDKHALEAALQLKDNYGAYVTVISMGPPQAKNALREALCMGADEAILLTDRAFGGADTLATSKTIAAAIKNLEYDIIFGGRQAIDGDTAQVGPEIAEHLNVPQVTYVQGVEVTEDGLVVNRALEDGYELIKVQTPVLLTAIEELNHPRYMNVQYIFDTAEKEVKVMTAADLDVPVEELGLKELNATYFGEDARFYNYDGKEITITQLKENGDFRSNECIQVLKQSDIVITNPPFSLFREYISQLDKYDKDFLVISNINAITYKEVFPLIQSNKAWLGVCFGRGISGFIVPESYELYGTETKVDENGKRIISPNNCMWLTSLDNEKRHQPIELVKQYEGNEESYPFYDNYRGINVNKTQDIPMDYMGAMGVPITFLNKYDPEQFEIIKFRKGDDDKDLKINGKAPYFRILIKRKTA